jgi:hypothetical protein
MRILLFISFLLLCSFEMHQFHISKTDVTYKPTEKTLQITMHIFIDDLEKSLEKQGISKTYIGTEKEKQEANSLIIKYLQSNFSIKLNNKAIIYDFLGKETSNDKQAIWVYLEAKNVKDIKQIFVENKIITETYSDQKNIVQINVPSKKQGYFLLDKNKPSEMASF